jgi:hypothetical protein
MTKHKVAVRGRRTLAGRGCGSGGWRHRTAESLCQRPPWSDHSEAAAPHRSSAQDPRSWSLHETDEYVQVGRVDGLQDRTNVIRPEIVQAGLQVVATGQAHIVSTPVTCIKTGIRQTHTQRCTSCCPPLPPNAPCGVMAWVHPQGTRRDSTGPTSQLRGGESDQHLSRKIRPFSTKMDVPSSRDHRSLVGTIDVRPPNKKCLKPQVTSEWPCRFSGICFDQYRVSLCCLPLTPTQPNVRATTRGRSRSTDAWQTRSPQR